MQRGRVAKSPTISAPRTPSGSRKGRSCRLGQELLASRDLEQVFLKDAARLGYGFVPASNHKRGSKGVDDRVLQSVNSNHAIP